MRIGGEGEGGGREEGRRTQEGEREEGDGPKGTFSQKE